MKPLIRETEDKKYFEVIGHYDNPILCAKLTAIADLFAVEKKEGYAKFRIEDESKLAVIDDELKFVITDLTGTTWIFNEELGTYLDNFYYINFISNNNNFIGINYLDEDGYDVLYYFITNYSSESPYTYGEWGEPDYKTITITGGTDATNTTLIAWLQANAVMQEEPQPTASSFKSIKLNGNVLTINGTDYILDGTSEVVDANESSFKGISAVDNGNGTITLTVGANSITVNKYTSS